MDRKIQLQIASYIKDYNYTYSGILKTLIYFYNIQKNDISKSNGGIGIVPYVYQQAHDYYKELWETQQKNAAKDLSQYRPKENVITIRQPQRKIRRKPIFKFLDEEGEEDG